MNSPMLSTPVELKAMRSIAWLNLMLLFVSLVIYICWLLLVAAPMRPFTLFAGPVSFNLVILRYEENAWIKASLIAGFCTIASAIFDVLI